VRLHDLANVRVVLDTSSRRIQGRYLGLVFSSSHRTVSRTTSSIRARAAASVISVCPDRTSQSTASPIRGHLPAACAACAMASCALPILPS
jgi:hypothetical protein